MRKSKLFLLLLCLAFVSTSALVMAAPPTDDPAQALSPHRILLPIVRKLFPLPTPTPTATATLIPTATPTQRPAQTGTIQLSGEPRGLAINPNNGRLYVARYQARDVAVLDLYTLSWITNIALNDQIAVARVNASLGRLYAAYGTPLYVISCANHAILAQIRESIYNPYELAINSSNHRLYLADWTVWVGEQDKVQVYDGLSNNRLGSVNLGVSPYIERIGVAVDPQTGLAYAAYTGDRQVAVIGPDLTIRRRIQPSSMSGSPDVALNPATKRLYVRGGGRTSVIDLTTNREIATLDKAGPLALDRNRNRIYIQNGGKVYVYNGANNTRVREIALGSYVYVTHMICHPATRRIFLAAPYDNQIIVLAD